MDHKINNNTEGREVELRCRICCAKLSQSERAALRLHEIENITTNREITLEQPQGSKDAIEAIARFLKKADEAHSRVPVGEIVKWWKCASNDDNCIGLPFISCLLQTWNHSKSLQRRLRTSALSILPFRMIHSTKMRKY